jgi:hypothetical protein
MAKVCGEKTDLRQNRLVYTVKAGIRTEAGGDFDVAVFLVVLEEGGDYTRKCEGAAVEGVCELHLAVLVLVTEVEAVGLIALEVGDG